MSEFDTRSKTAELVGPALDWAVAKCEKRSLTFAGRKWPTDGATAVEYAPWAVSPVIHGAGPYVASLCHAQFSPSTDWSQGGPIIDREGIELKRSMTKPFVWAAFAYRSPRAHRCGPTPLIAAMRCFVASKMGDEVDVPSGLLKE